MTVIAGLEHEGKVWLAGESELSTKRTRFTMARSKVWVRDGLVWGVAGDSRPGDMLRYALRTPRLPRVEIDYYVITDLVPAVHALLVSDGIQNTDWSALVGIRGELWLIDSEGYQAERCGEGYSAIGCGASAALVGLALTGKLAPRARLTRVVGAVSKHVPGCGGKISVECA